MTATEKAQADIDTLKGKLKDFDAQLTALREELQQKRQKAGELMLKGKSSDALDSDLLRQESRVRTFESAKKAAEDALTQAGKDLHKAKLSEAQERMKALRQEIDRTTNILEIELRGASESARRFEDLLEEAWKIRNQTGISLSPLGTWVSLGPNCFLSRIINEHAAWLSQAKPKGGT
jgi:predicted RNase H-like nuclease (RuvC/YqgF family)